MVGCNLRQRQLAQGDHLKKDASFGRQRGVLGLAGLLKPARTATRAVPVRDLASLMGHDVKIHQKHYGQWTTDEDTKESVRRAVGELANAS